MNIEYKTIGLFNDSYPPIFDGVSIATQNYARHFFNKKNSVCVITPKVPKNIETDEFPVVRYTSLPLFFRKPYRIGIPELDFDIKSTLDNIPFKIVHAHSPFSSGKLALRIARKRNIPIVATFHSKYRDDFERSVKNKKIANWMVKDVIHFYNQVDEVWIPQAAVEETMREYGYKGKVVVVENGNDYATSENLEMARKQAKNKLQINENEFTFLFVGQHIWEKNTRLIVESLALLKDFPFKMFFVGTGYAANDLKQLVNDLDLSSKVKFTGVIRDREELKQYYLASDLFLFPSIYDNAPLVVREAAALQTPSILTKHSTASEIITDNFNGFLTENNPKALAAKISDLTQNTLLLSKAGLNARQTIARSWEDVAEEVLDRYQYLISKPFRWNIN